MDPTPLESLHHELVHALERSGSLDREEAILRSHATTLADKLFPQMEIAERTKIVTRVLERMVKWGPLTSLLEDPSITEIMVNGMQSVYVERNGKLECIPNEFQNEEEILFIIQRMASRVGRRIDASSPLVDARLPDGSRINAIIPPLSLSGPILTIRRFSAHAPSLQTLVERGSLNAGAASFLNAAIQARQNIVISGGTGSGKTTTLNALAGCIDPSERLITIEDAAEMRIQHPHLVGLEARAPNLEGKGEIPVRLLIKNALRMRPDRIIIGEIRGAESLDMLQAMNTGHQGSLTTVHANAPLESLLRIETMTLMADVELPLAAIREQIRKAIHLLVFQERLRDGSRKITSIQALVPRSQDARDPSPYSLEVIFEFDKLSGIFRGCGKIPSIAHAFEAAGVVLQPEWFAV